MPSRFGVVIILGALAGIAVALLVVGQSRTAPPQSTGTVQIGGPFELVRTTGATVKSADLAGEPMLVYFGFTNCPDICPAGLQQISAALDKLGTQAAGLHVVFITLDPERDTPAKLGEYMKSFHPAIMGLTGSLDAVTAAAKAYRVYFKKVETGTTPTEYTIDHSGFMYLMDGSGRYIAHFPHNVTADKLSVGILAAIKPAP